MSKKVFFAVIGAAMLILSAGCKAKVSVETGGVSGISGNDAIVSGHVGDYEEMPANVGIFFGKDENSMEKLIRDKTNGGLVKAPEINAEYDLTIDAGEVLEPETTYYYQFFARVNGKDVKGEIKSFTTVAKLPEADVTVETGDATDITATDAVMHSRLSNYETKPDETGVYFGESAESLKKIAKNKNPMKQYKNMKSFEVWYTISLDTDMTLEPSTTYYYQCYAKIGDTESKGEIKSFTTAAE